MPMRYKELSLEKACIIKPVITSLFESSSTRWDYICLEKETVGVLMAVNALDILLQKVVSIKCDIIPHFSNVILFYERFEKNFKEGSFTLNTLRTLFKNTKLSATEKRAEEIKKYYTLFIITKYSHPADIIRIIKNLIKILRYEKTKWLILSSVKYFEDEGLFSKSRYLNCRVFGEFLSLSDK